MKFKNIVSKILKFDKKYLIRQIREKLSKFLLSNDLLDDDIVIEVKNKQLTITCYWEEDQVYLKDICRILRPFIKNIVFEKDKLTADLTNLLTEDWKSALSGVFLAGTTIFNPLEAEAKPTNSIMKQEQPQTDISKKQQMVARVLFGEAGGTGPSKKTVTDEERFLVASTIANRIGNKAFGNPEDPLEVVTAPKQYSAYNSLKNILWKLSEKPSQLSDNVKNNWYKSLMLANKLFTNVVKWNKDVVAYHDKSIKKPNDWDSNKYWKYIPVKTTDNFIFYKIEPKT